MRSWRTRHRVDQTDLLALVSHDSGACQVIGAVLPPAVVVHPGGQPSLRPPEWMQSALSPTECQKKTNEQNSPSRCTCKWYTDCPARAHTIRIGQCICHSLSPSLPPGGHSTHSPPSWPSLMTMRKPLSSCKSLATRRATRSKWPSNSASPSSALDNWARSGMAKGG